MLENRCSIPSFWSRKPKLCSTARPPSSNTALRQSQHYRRLGLLRFPHLTFFRTNQQGSNTTSSRTLRSSTARWCRFCRSSACSSMLW